MSTPTIVPEVKVEFSVEQQAHIQRLFDARFATVKTKAEEALKPLQDKVAELELEKAELLKKVTPPVADKPTPSDAEREQTLSLLRAEQTNTAAAKSAWEIEKKRADELENKNAEINRNQAIRDAASNLEGGLQFHDLPMVTELVKNTIVLDKDTGTYVVKINGVVKQNSSLLPMTLSEYFLEYATQRPYLVKSQVKGGTGSQESTTSQSAVGVVHTKADLKTTAQKIAYIDKFGLDKFEKLATK